MTRILTIGIVALAALFSFPATAQQLCGREGEEFCQQGYIYQCQRTGSELTPIYQNRKCEVNVPSLTGTWRGVGHQSPAGTGGSDYQVVMSINEGGGSIDYPSLGCGGSLTRLSGTATSAQYREHITYGKCIDGGSVSINLFQGRLAWTWIGQSAGQQYTVIAVLER